MRTPFAVLCVAFSFTDETNSKRIRYSTDFTTPADVAAGNAKLLVNTSGLNRGRLWVNGNDAGRYYLLERNDASACPNPAGPAPAPPGTCEPSACVVVQPMRCQRLNAFLVVFVVSCVVVVVVVVVVVGGGGRDWATLPVPLLFRILQTTCRCRHYAPVGGWVVVDALRCGALCCVALRCVASVRRCVASSLVRLPVPVAVDTAARLLG